MPRWITVRRPFDYRWPDQPAVTHFSKNDLGEHFVKDELADFAVARGHATEGKIDASARSTKGKRRKAPAKAADSGSDDGVAGPDLADAHRAAGGQSLDRDAE